MPNFTIDLKSKPFDFPHYWSRCVGSCHAVTGLREDWRWQLWKCQQELGFKYVRFHGLLSDPMSVYSRERKGDKYSFYNIDSIFDFLLSIGMKPFVELGFMPEDMASGKETIFHYKANVTPPGDYNEWSELIETLVTHLVSRYGKKEVRQWFFEVWNEPDLEGFWSGTQQEYFKLYKYSVNAVKKVDSKLRVGGPATSRNKWIPDMINFCKKEKLPLDFVSTHHYPSDVALGMDMDMEDRLAAGDRNTLKKMTAKAREEAGNLPLYYTEWNTSSSVRDHYHDEPYGACHVMKAIADNQGVVDIYSFWTFTDIFEEMAMPSIPFYGGFGLLNIHGIPKPWYRTFELLGRTGKKRLSVETILGSTCEAFAVKKRGELMIIAHNHNVPRAPIKTEKVKIVLKNIKRVKKAVIERIDDNNANPAGAWKKMGSPTYPDRKQLNAIMKASELKPKKIPCRRTREGLVIKFDVPAHGVACITLTSKGIQ